MATCIQNSMADNTDYKALYDQLKDDMEEMKEEMKKMKVEMEKMKVEMEKKDKQLEEKENELKMLKWVHALQNRCFVQYRRALPHGF